MGVRHFHKCTRAGGISFYDDETRYVVGTRLSVDDPSPAGAGACARGLHVLSELVYVRKYVDVDLRQCEFYQVAVAESDIIVSDATKTRVGSLYVSKRISEADLGILRGKLFQVIGYGYGAGAGYGYGYGYGDGYG